MALESNEKGDDHGKVYDAISSESGGVSVHVPRADAEGDSEMVGLEGIAPEERPLETTRGTTGRGRQGGAREVEGDYRWTLRRVEGLSAGAHVRRSEGHSRGLADCHRLSDFGRGRECGDSAGYDCVANRARKSTGRSACATKDDNARSVGSCGPSFPPGGGEDGLLFYKGVWDEPAEPGRRCGARGVVSGAANLVHPGIARQPVGVADACGTEPRNRPGTPRQEVPLFHAGTHAPHEVARGKSPGGSRI